MADSYAIDAEKIDVARFVLAIDSKEKFVAKKNEVLWYRLISSIPSSLKLFLKREIESGNDLASIGLANWPSQGSIVINLKRPFGTNVSSGEFENIYYRKLNDPHYCQEEVSAIQDGIEYLIIH